MNREERILYLLETLDDWIPAIGRTEFASAPGPAPSKVRCPECRGMGKTLVFDPAARCKRLKLCLACGGERWVRARKGDEPEDPYLVERRKESGKPHTFVVVEQRETMPLHEIDRTIERLQSDAEEREGKGPRWRDPRDAHDRKGSYPELRILLDVMRFNEPALYQRRSSGPGVAWLSERMPDDIHIPRRLIQEQDTQKRRATIMELVALGYSKKRIARELRVDLRTVKRALAAASVRAG